MAPCSLCSPALRRNGLVHHLGWEERKGERRSTAVVLIGLAVSKAFVPTPRLSVLCLCVFPANALWVLSGPKLDCLVGTSIRAGNWECKMEPRVLGGTWQTKAPKQMLN